MKKLLVLGSLVSMMATPLMACDVNGNTGFVPENDLNISVGQNFNPNMTEERFGEIIADVEKLYAPIVEAKGKTLKVVNKWDDGTVNAYAMQKGDVWEVHMFGGLARHETITEDAFAAVVCHELGHHLGGAPKKTSFGGKVRWASNEGQSDYWGTSKCLKRYFENDDNKKIISTMKVDEHALKTCKEVFSNEEEVAICARGAMAGLSLGNLFRALRRMTTKLSFLTPDQKEVSKTSHSHPQPQCRVDTYFHGSLCDKDAEAEVSDTDADQGFCARGENYLRGIRPLCWYKPSANK